MELINVKIALLQIGDGLHAKRNGSYKSLGVPVFVSQVHKHHIIVKDNIGYSVFVYKEHILIDALNENLFFFYTKKFNNGYNHVSTYEE